MTIKNNEVNIGNAQKRGNRSSISNTNTVYQPPILPTSNASYTGYYPVGYYPYYNNQYMYGNTTGVGYNNVTAPTTGTVGYNNVTTPTTGYNYYPNPGIYPPNQ